MLVAAAVLLPDLVALDRWLPFAATVALRPVLTAATAVLVLLLALWRRRRGTSRRAGTVALVGTALVVGVAAALVVPRTVAADPPPPGGTPLTVLSFNAYEGQADVDVLADLVRRERPDLVVLPEAGDRFRARLAALLPAYRSWSNVPPGVRDVRGVTVLAAPRAGDVTARTISEPPGSPGDTRYPWAEVTGGILGPVRLGAVHVVSIVPQWIGYWPGELALLARWCSPAAGPSLVVGDLNATPDHSAFRAGTRGCADAAGEVGAGLRGTWPASWPAGVAAPIDHVLTANGPRAREVAVADVPGSDHRALVVRLRL
ncbi:endonuclease/exonuclease/phosphatase family protein [Actinomycetospora sp. CA-101289]|uniref:endonuclease/exonuclease/phosphatase family protein n=1 Tax=Actinomycetospora sp. CA-101289 TaxID=3239893 RepID=UPI003D98FBD7